MKLIIIKRTLGPALLTLLTTMALAPFTNAESPNWQLRGAELMSYSDYTHAKFEVRMYSREIIGTTSTFFLWREPGWQCGTQWNEIDIETIPKEGRYQSNPIWQTSDNDCSAARRDEELHGSSATIYNNWVTYTLEWTPNYIEWSRYNAQGQEVADRRISRWSSNSNFHESVEYIQNPMRFAFNLWTQGHANPYWLGNLDFNAIRNSPVYQFVDYVKIYDWNGSGFNSNPTVFNFNSQSEIDNNFRKGDWNFGESQGYVRWDPSAMGIVDIGNGNRALWLGLFHADSGVRAPQGAEIPVEGGSGGGSVSGNSCTLDDGTTYALRNLNSGRYVDVSGVSESNGANIHQWGTSVGGNHRRFTAVSQNNGWFGLRAVHSNRYLNVARNAQWNGANVIQWGTSGHYHNSQFRGEPAPDGSCRLRIRHSNKCLTVANVATNNGANIEQYECNGSVAQSFDIQFQW